MREMIIGAVALGVLGVSGCTLEWDGNNVPEPDWIPDAGLVWVDADQTNPCDPGDIDASLGWPPVDAGKVWPDAGGGGWVDAGGGGEIDAGKVWPDAGGGGWVDAGGGGEIDAGPAELDAGVGTTPDAGSGTDCPSITSEAVCTVTPSCEAVYSGVNCECYPDGTCSCESWEFDSCQ